MVIITGTVVVWMITQDDEDNEVVYQDTGTREAYQTTSQSSLVNGGTLVDIYMMSDFIVPENLTPVNLNKLMYLTTIKRYADNVHEIK